MSADLTVPSKTVPADKALSSTERTRIRRLRERGQEDRAELYAVLDAGLICHLGVIVKGSPVVLPTGYGRDGDTLYLHGSPGSRMLRNLGRGIDVCVTATLLDGLVLARSVYHHSMNYRSVVVLGRAREVTDRGEKLRAMERVVEHVVPGRWADARQPSEGELKGTTILAISLDEASAKLRAGGPTDDEADLELPVWAGVIPLELVPAAPAAANDERVPSYAERYRRPNGSLGGE